MAIGYGDTKKRLSERAKLTREAAHKRVVSDGTVQFRLDAESMDRLLQAADGKRMGIGVLARMWVVERLQQETMGVWKEATSSTGMVRESPPAYGGADTGAELQQQVSRLTEIVQTLYMEVQSLKESQIKTAGKSPKTVPNVRPRKRV